jgi:hypothetical protein
MVEKEKEFENEVRWKDKILHHKAEAREEWEKNGYVILTRDGMTEELYGIKGEEAKKLESLKTPHRDLQGRIFLTEENSKRNRRKTPHFISYC